MGIFTRTTHTPAYTKNVANPKQRFEIGKLLEQHCSLDLAGYARYERGWSDEMIAKTVGCGPNSVAGLRKALIGRLIDHGGINSKIKAQQASLALSTPVTPTVTNGGTEPKSKFLHERFAALEEEIANLRAEINHLKSDLGVSY